MRYSLDMKMKYLFMVATVCFSAMTVFGQSGPTPRGASKFIQSFGGLSPDNYEPSFFEEMTNGKIDKVFAGGGAGEWTEIDGRIFLTQKWSIEIGEIKENYNTYDLNAGIAATMRNSLKRKVSRSIPRHPPFHQYVIRRVRPQVRSNF